MDSLTGDPILEELLLAYIEPKMLECIKRYGVESNGMRKLLAFERFYGKRLERFDHEELLYSLVVAYHTKENYDFRFNIYKDGRVEG